MVDWSGTVHRFGNGDRPFVRIRLHKRSLGWRLPLYPELKTGEAYMDGSLTIEDGSIYDFLDLVTMNLGHGRRPATMRLTAGLGFALRAFYQFNTASRARATTAHHYDLSAALYELFLDRDRQYSCAYFTHADESLDEAQENKKRRIAAKLGLEPGQRILDIGSGWGGMALYLAREAGGDVTGITLSTMQRELAERRANETGLSERAHFFLRDYRQQTGTFERIVSVGMFEHVGVNHYREFFAKLGELLADDGIAVLHTIGRAGPPAEADPWIRKYIFSGRLHPIAFRGRRCDREDRPRDHRHRGPAPSLRRDLAPLARAVRGQPRGRQEAVRRAVLPNVGVLPRRMRGFVSQSRQRGLPDPNWPSARISCR